MIQVKRELCSLQLNRSIHVLSFLYLITFGSAFKQSYPKTRISLFGSNRQQSVSFLAAKGGGCSNDEYISTESLWSSCRSFVATGMAASVLFFNTAPSLDGSHPFCTLPPSTAWAEVATDIPSGSSTTSATDTNILEETSLPKPDGILQVDPNAPVEPTLLEPAMISQETSVIDEVWSLVDKYYLDRTFNGQDWNKVKEKYTSLNSKSKNDEQTMKLVTEMVKSLDDKYSRVLDAKQYSAIQKYDLIGVGVTLMPNGDKQLIVGAPPVAGSASDKSGLKKGDFIEAVNGIPTKGRNAFDIIDQISENPNAETVTMTARTEGPDDLPGEGYKRDVTMNRAFQEVRNPVLSKISETRSDGTKVGYVRILEFNSLIKGKLEEALARLENEGANAFVLDVRSNPGGAFQSAVEISSLFFEDRIATYVVDSNEVELPFKTTKGRVLVNPQYPIAIWVDAGSASASEVFAGSMHDNCRAVVMGEQKSFGKGLIQAVYGLKNGAGLVLTVANYVTPNGTIIQGQGITPDIKGKVAIDFPGLSTDTSKVDFRDISKRLGPDMCTLPQPR